LNQPSRDRVCVRGASRAAAPSPPEGQGEGKADYVHNANEPRQSSLDPRWLLFTLLKQVRGSARSTNMARTAVAPRSVGQGVADAFNLLVCAGSPVAIAGGASALVAVPAFLLSALRGTMEGWVQL